MQVVITGASRGIGKELAEHFAKEGANLFLCSRNMEKTILWQRELMSKYDIKITCFNADLGDEVQTKNFAEQLLKATDQIDILINNTGTYEPGSIYNEPEGQMEKIMAVNFYSAYHLTRALIPSMIKRKAGNKTWAANSHVKYC